MTVYVGPCMWEFRGWLMGHMFCDPGSVDELHSLASQIGLRRSWFQDKPRHPHYDITDRYRRAAIRAGAVDLPSMHEEARIHEVHARMRDHTPGKVRDLYTGRVVSRTWSIQQRFFDACVEMQRKHGEIYVVHGRNRRSESAHLVARLEAQGIPCVYDSRTPADVMYIIQGDPAEWTEGGE